METFYLPPFDNLVEKLGSLPGVGEKTAMRLAYHILNMKRTDALSIADAIYNCREKVSLCKVCCNLAMGDLCRMCKDDNRDKSVICVVEEPKDVLTFERLGKHNWSYHVLHGVISPMAGIGPNNIRIKELLARITPEVQEVIMAVSPTAEGDATSMYISKLIKLMDVRVTRLAYGVPVGINLEYADTFTLQMALEGRLEL